MRRAGWLLCWRWCRRSWTPGTDRCRRLRLCSGGWCEGFLPRASSGTLVWDGWKSRSVSTCAQEWTKISAFRKTQRFLKVFDCSNRDYLKIITTHVHAHCSSAPQQRSSQPEKSEKCPFSCRLIIISTMMIITWDPYSNNDAGFSGREVVQTRKRKAISKCTLFLRSLRTSLLSGSSLRGGDPFLSDYRNGRPNHRAAQKHDDILELQNNPFSSCVDLYDGCLLPACAC